MATFVSPNLSVAQIVDHTALRVNQSAIILISAIAFVLNAPWLVALLCLALALGTAVPALAPFKGLYARVLLPAGLVRPDRRLDDPAPHRFAQGMGAGVLALAVVALLLKASSLGWTLVGLVAVLAAVNVLAGFCAGCFIYYQLGRRGLLPGAHPARR